MQLEEKIAELCHEQWSHWMRYMLTQGVYEDRPPWRFWLGPAHLLRWERQAELPYSELSEEEKESDREWARKYIELFAQELYGNPIHSSEYPDGVGVPPCTCRVAATLPDGTRYLGGVDDCPVHGLKRDV